MKEAKMLRLLLFEECNRNCPGCCNKDWDLPKLPVCKDYRPYEIIMLTGGEPMLKPRLILDIISDIRRTSKAKIYVYTAKVDALKWALYILQKADGITLTLHNQADVRPWRRLAARTKHLIKTRSLRLNVFDGVNLGNSDTTGWTVKSGIKWIENCPLPKDEVFMRLSPNI